MIKRVNTYKETEAEKAFLKKIHKEHVQRQNSKASARRDELAAEGGELEQFFTARFLPNWRENFHPESTEIADTEGVLHKDCVEYSGLILENNKRAWLDAAVSAYLAVTLMKRLLELPNDYDKAKLLDIEEQKEKGRLFGTFDTVCREVMGDYAETPDGKLTKRLIRRLYFHRMCSEEKTIYYGDTQEWRRFILTGMTFYHEEMDLYVLIAKTVQVMKAAEYIQKYVFLENISAPTVILGNEIRMLYNSFAVIFSEIVGHTAEFTDYIGYTEDGKYVGEKPYDPGLPPLADDQPEYDEEGNPLAYEWNEEERKWDLLGTISKDVLMV